MRRTDIVHFDLKPANILFDRDALTGIVDWNVPFPGAIERFTGVATQILAELPGTLD